MRNYILIGIAVTLAIAFSAYYINTQKRLQEAVAAIGENKHLHQALGLNKGYNTLKIDSLTKSNLKLDSLVRHYRQKSQQLQFDNQLISDKYKLLINEISTAPDSVQYAITMRLLANYKRYQ